MTISLKLASDGKNLQQTRVGDLTTGVLTGGAMTVNGGDTAKFDVAAGTGYVVDYTDPAAPVVTFVSFGPFVAEDPLNIGTTFFTTIGVDSAGAIVKSDSPATSVFRRDNILLQTVLHDDFATVTGFSANQHSAYNVTQALIDFTETHGLIDSGNEFSAASTDLTIAKAAGVTSQPFINFINDPDTPNDLTNAAASPASFLRSHRDGAGGYTFVSTVSAIDAANFDDDSGTPATVSPSNRFQIKRIFHFGELGEIVVVYGQALYTSLDDAQAAIFTENTDIDPIVLSGTFKTALIVRGNATDLSDSAQARFVEIRVASTSSAAGGGTEFADNVFRIQDDGDATKEIAFQASGITTATLRTITMPDADLTLLVPAGLAGGQTIVGDTASGGDLTLESTANATKGSIILAAGTNLDASDEDIINIKVATFDSKHTASSSSGSVTIDFSDGQKYEVTLTENITTIVLTAPPGPSNFMLVFKQASSGGPWTVAGWPAAAQFVDDTAPTMPATASEAMVLGLYYDGTDYFIGANLPYLFT